MSPRAKSPQATAAQRRLHIDAGGPFARRLKAARKAAELTQQQLAVHAGLDEESASARISQYETGKHVPTFQTAIRLAAALAIPVEYLYSPDDATADLLLLWHKMPRARRRALLETLRSGV